MLPCQPSCAQGIINRIRDYHERGVMVMDRHINVPMTKEDTLSLKAGDYVYLTGTIYTARDAAHKRMDETLIKVECCRLT